MPNIPQLLQTLQKSPSVKLLALKNKETILEFLASTFSDEQTTISSENIHIQLADFLEFKQEDSEQENETEKADTYEDRAKNYITRWTNNGFLTNYSDEQGEAFYELSAHTSKTIDWLSSLKKDEFVGTESKFNNLLHQLKELVEFTNEDAEKRIELLEARKKEIEQQIQQLKVGEEVKVFEEFEIIPRFNQLNQSAKELLSDFKEVEGNFEDITKGIYQKHADGNLSKGDILGFTFDALESLKDSPQGKSFYAFWSFILNPALQENWENLTHELYETLAERDIDIKDSFLKGMKKHLHRSGQKVYKANDRMAKRLTRIIRESENSKTEATLSLIQEIKNQLVELSKQDQKPKFAFDLEGGVALHLPFERQLTFERKEEVNYTQKPTQASADLTSSKHLHKLFSQTTIDKPLLRKRIRTLLQEKKQTTLLEVVEHHGGIEKGLPELFAYIAVAKEFKHSIHTEKTQHVIFDAENKKRIKIPEIIIVA